MGELRTVDLAAPAGDAATGLRASNASSFGEDACGRLLVVSLNGPVYRLRRRRAFGVRARGAAAGAGHADTGRRHARLRRVRARERAAQRAAVAAADAEPARRRGLPGHGERRGFAASRRSGRRGRSLGAGKRGVVRVRLTARGARAVRRALRRRASLRVTLPRAGRRRGGQRPDTRPRGPCERLTAMLRAAGLALLLVLARGRAGLGRAYARSLGTFSSPTWAGAPASEPIARVRDRAGRGACGVIVDGVVQSTPFLDLTGITRVRERARAAVGRVRARLRDVRALLRLPDGHAGGLASDTAGEIQIREYRRSAVEPERRRPGSGRLLLAIQHSNAAQPQRRAGAASARTASCGWRRATAAARTTSTGTRRTRRRGSASCCGWTRRRSRSSNSRRACATRGGSRSRRRARS